ncbi:dihydropteroate synthase [Rhodobacteraceae bacterium NNCM2]|nr:dihydropteroate synthase [Coraliihabitans acroporae]
MYLRPIIDTAARAGAAPLAGGWRRFAEVEVLRRGAPPEILPVAAVEALYGAEPLARLSRARADQAGLVMSAPRIMGIVNVTPDSFSDGGQFGGASAAIDHGLALVEAGAEILDIGGESTRPGAETVPEGEELARVIPVIEGLVAAGCRAAISIDTRKAAVARAAIAAGAALFNDVSAFSHDADSINVAAPSYCLMHAQGDPRTMQQNPSYDDVLLDVFDYLESRVAAAEAAGIARERLIVDPGIGFGKTLDHNIALIRGLAVFHALGCPILLGVSRKRFIGTISGQAEASRRAPGSIAAGLWGIGQGAQILRVHDVAETAEALRVWQALEEGSQ